MEITYKHEFFHSIEELELLILTLEDEGYHLIECFAPKAIFRKVSRNNEQV